jgi:peptidoglycan/LPS O-acetylase OafA/YrhL
MLFALDYAPYFSTGILFFDITKFGWSSASGALLVLAALTELFIGGWTTTLTALLAASLVWLAVRGRLSFLVSRATLGLGAISYSLYVIHRNLGYKALDWLHAHHVSAAVAMPVVILGSIAVAALMTYGIERPALTAIRKWHRSSSGREDRAAAPQRDPPSAGGTIADAGRMEPLPPARRSR